VAVVDGVAYTLGDQGESQYAVAVSAAGKEQGKVLWKTKLGPAWDDQYLGPRSTPTVDGERIYVTSTEGGIFCLKASDGSVVWQRSLPKDFGGVMMKARGTYEWKFSESPLVDGDRVIVTPGVQDAALVALNKATGEEIWRAKIPALGERGEDGAAYASVVISEGGGVRHYVQLIGRGLIGVEAETGRFLWGYNRVANGVANIATPLIDGDHVFASTGYDTGAALVHLKGDGKGGVTAEEVYFLPHTTVQNHHGGLILDGGTVYTGTGHNKGFPLALTMASGEVLWGPIRNEGRSSAAITYADGRIYFRYQDGRMILVEASPEGYKEHGSFQIPEVHRESWSHPVVADGKLFLREQDNLFVYDLKPPKPPKPSTPSTPAAAEGR
jgi:outer membrane protein assembly factor BamB